ncbi:hypothetical protein CB1_000746003 [Camelus ferus]|nr:hypothetical protein CB1_000746003 [Camelus ferus]
MVRADLLRDSPGLSSQAVPGQVRAQESRGLEGLEQIQWAARVSSLEYSYDRVLLCSPGNRVRFPVITCNGQDSERSAEGPQEPVADKVMKIQHSLPALGGFPSDRWL